jgi:pimeloyl-ACP methyl ester carboxylesterase
MTPSRTRGSTDAERPIFFDAGSETLCGVFSMPRNQESSAAVILLGGGGTTPTTTERNRFFVTLARELSASGYATLRFDYHGIGDSTGGAAFRLDRPFLSDLGGAVAWLADEGVDRYVIVGSCFGARTALSAGPDLPGLSGLLLLAPPLRDFALSESKTEGWGVMDYVKAGLRPRRLLGRDEPLTPRRYARFAASGGRLLIRQARERVPGGSGELSWVSRRFLVPLGRLAERGVPILIVFGSKDAEYRDFERARAQGFEPMLQSWPTVSVETLEGQVHAFTRVASQAPTRQLIMRWIDRTVRKSSAAADAS